MKYKRAKLEIDFLTSQEDNHTKSGAQTCSRTFKTDDSQCVVLAAELLPPTSTSRHIHVMNAPRPSSLFFFCRSSAPVYYCEHKQKVKRRGGLGMRLSNSDYRIQSKVVQGCTGRRNEVTHWDRRIRYCGERGIDSSSWFSLHTNRRQFGIHYYYIAQDDAPGRDITCYLGNPTVEE